MTVFLEELGLTAYLTTWECPEDVGKIPADHVALLDYQPEDVVRLTDDQFGNARWATWQALELHSANYPFDIPLHPSSRPWKSLANEYYHNQEDDRASARAKILRGQQQLEAATQESLGIVWVGLGQGPRGHQQDDSVARKESGATNGDVRETIEKDDGEETEINEDLEEESDVEETEDKEEDTSFKQPKRASTGKADKRYRGAEKGPRCKFCRQSKKGCDGKQPCGRCEQAGRVCVPDS